MKALKIQPFFFLLSWAYLIGQSQKHFNQAWDSPKMDILQSPPFWVGYTCYPSRTQDMGKSEVLSRTCWGTPWEQQTLNPKAPTPTKC